MNGIVFDQIIGKFCQLWHTNNPGLYLWLFGDQLGCHLNINTVRRAWTYYVRMWLFPANASHFLQPLDSVPFARFKKELRATSYSCLFEAEFSGIDRTHLYFALALDVEEKVFTASVLTKSFSTVTTGIFPWNPARIMSLARTNTGKLEGAEGDRVGVSVDTLISAAVEIINNSAANGKARLERRQVKKVRVSKDQVYDPEERIRCAAEAEASAAEAAATKELKQQAKKDAKATKAAEKASRTCVCVGCHRVSPFPPKICVTLLEVLGHTQFQRSFTIHYLLEIFSRKF